MKTSFISNYLTHHQIPFCTAMFEKLQHDYCFVETEKMEAERIDMGWYVSEYPYVIKAWKDETAFEKAKVAILQSDTVILGACSDLWYEFAKRSNAKIVFCYGERIFKKGLYQRFGIGARRYKKKIGDISKIKNSYVLCASAFLPYDLAVLGLMKDRCFKWGYFPPVIEYEDIERIVASKRPLSILWAGRLIGWKHPEDVIYLAKKLKEKGYEIDVTLIGDGELKPQLEKMIADVGLSDYIKILGFMASEEVRHYMEKADIYLFTSDRFEGWGAVLNEAMNAGCAVVANREIGSVPYLIQDKNNGLIYDRKKTNDLFNKTAYLIANKDIKRNIQIEAYRTIIDKWNGQVAADRLLNLSDMLIDKYKTDCTDGPCSVAQVIRG